jgi:hypothetical protein
MKSTLVVGAACLAGLACRMDDPCAPKETACGGDPTGLWTVTDSCRYPAYDVPKPVTYFDQASTMARQPPPEPSSSDWCSYLQYDPQNGITQFTFPHDQLAVASGTVTYDGVGFYAAKLQVTGPGSVDISASCLSRFGVVYQCAEADPAALPAGVRSVANDLKTYSIPLGAPAQNIACGDDGNLGCFCTYELASEPSGGGLAGRWSTQGQVITHFPDSQLIPSQADLCVGDNTMTIWGHDRTWLWDQPGLRTISLVRMTAQP